MYKNQDMKCRASTIQITYHTSKHNWEILHGFVSSTSHQDGLLNNIRNPFQNLWLGLSKGRRYQKGAWAWMWSIQTGVSNGSIISCRTQTNSTAHNTNMVGIHIPFTECITRPIQCIPNLKMCFDLFDCWTVPLFHCSHASSGLELRTLCSQSNWSTPVASCIVQVL